MEAKAGKLSRSTRIISVIGVDKARVRPGDSRAGGRGSGLRLGFTLVELVVAVAIVVTLAAVALSTMNPGQDSDMDRARLAAAQLAEIREAINGFQVTLRPTSFKQNTGVESPLTAGKNPIRISDLTNKISSTAGTPNSVNSCAGTYLSGEVTRWGNTGPYWDGIVTPSGVVLAPGFVAQDLMTATKVTPGSFPANDAGQYLAIRMPSVALTDAQNLAQLVDGNTTGAGLLRTIKFTPVGTAAIPVDYIVLINGC